MAQKKKVEVEGNVVKMTELEAEQASTEEMEVNEVEEKKRFVSFKELGDKILPAKKEKEEVSENVEKKSFTEKVLEKRALKAQQRLEEYQENKTKFVVKRVAIGAGIAAGAAAAIAAYKEATFVGLDGDTDGDWVDDNPDIIDVEAFDSAESEAPTDE